MRGRWSRDRAVAIAVGGAAGASLRWVVVTSFEPGAFPWPVLAVNIVGSVMLGGLLAKEWSHPSARLWLHDAGAIGFCGGLTTFSTLSVEVVDLVRDGKLHLAALYTVTSVATAIAGVLIGARALRSGRSVMLPVEEQP